MKFESHLNSNYSRDISGRNGELSIAEVASPIHQPTDPRPSTVIRAYPRLSAPIHAKINFKKCLSPIHRPRHSIVPSLQRPNTPSPFSVALMGGGGSTNQDPHGP